MNNHSEPSRRIEFDLFDLLWKLFMQWKAILIVCIIMALLLPAVKYMKDKQSYDNALNEQKKAEEIADLPVDKRIEDILSQLPDNQRDDVLFVMQQKELVRLQKDYLNNSILLNTDPTNQRQICYKYLIENNSNIDTQTFRDAYSSYLKCNTFINVLRKIVSPEAKPEYICELVNPESNEECSETSELLSVTIVVPEDTDIGTLTSAVDSTIIAAHDELSYSIGEHSIAIINTEDNHVYNKYAADKRSNITTSINNLNTSIDNAKSKLSNEQKVALEAIIIIENTADSVDSASNNPGESERFSDLEKPGFNKKYALLGFLLGIFLYTGIYIVLLILGRKLSSVSAASSVTGVRLLGEIYRLKNRTGLGKLFSSPAVARWRYGNKLDAITQTETIANVIDSVCTHNSADKVTLLMSGVDVCFKEYLGHIMDKCKSKSIIEEISLLNTDVMDEKALTTVSNAIYVVSSDTRTDILEKLTSICKDYDIRSLGTIYVELI